MTGKCTFIFISDSRGRGLDDYIDRYPLPPYLKPVFNVLPGTPIDKLKPVLENATANCDSYYCVIMAGICGLTERSWVDDQLHLNYPEDSRTQKVSNIVSTISELKLTHGNKLNICTIIPASLQAHFQHHNRIYDPPSDLEAQQQALENDVVQINNEIVRLNDGQITNINLSRRCLLKTKKKRQRSGSKIVYRQLAKFSYNSLPDGVHFSTDLKEICFRLIREAVIRDTSAELGSHRLQPWPVCPSQSNTSDTEEESDKDSDWDFRRKPTS